MVEIRDDIAHTQSKAADQALKILRAEPGVQRVEREDRERALVWAPAVTAEAIRRAMDAALPQ